MFNEGISFKLPWKNSKYDEALEKHLNENAHLGQLVTTINIGNFVVFIWKQ